MKSLKNMKNKAPKKTLIAAVIAAIVAALCCLGPLIVVLLGLGSAWMSVFTQIAFFRPVAIMLTVVFLGIAYWKLYITPKRRSIDQPCAKPETLRIYRLVFWVVVVIALLLLAFPWYVHWFW
ncbi:MAG: mercury transporter MerT [Gammaproteobacteria bacterium CG11_big_fil_rev_8_21_14_0_20_46_22]|nr:MAG: mercury transporter MerT [Gammaproteobacteria bacterium CG12_big_fil_rev_8_21_14_0_65_46_12]PIR11818.1 MAG: mercury transporter MerT [Gammaproteobacteria bacterium CG11_big_fil_rev_8_21_14_0_20_46_22]